MSIFAQTCGIVLLLVLLVFFLRHKKVELRTEQAFLACLLMTLACLFLDIFSIVAINRMDIFPQSLVSFICKSYLVSLVGESLFPLLYICIDIDSLHSARHLRRKLFFIGYACVFVVLIYSLPIYYYYDNGVVQYTYGPSVMITYVGALSLVISNFVIMFRQKTRINAMRREAVMLWMLLWVCTALIQLLNSALLIVGYGSAIGIMILYLNIENPESNLDRQSGMFNHNALYQYIRQKYQTGQRFSCLTIILKHSLVDMLHSQTETFTEIEIAKYLHSIPGVKVFKDSEDKILVLFKNEQNALEKSEQIREHFEQEWGRENDMYARCDWVFISDSQMVENEDDFLYLLLYVRQENLIRSDSSYLKVDMPLVNRMYEEKQAEAMLRDSLAEDRVSVFYQPIYSNREKRFTCAEALVRITDKDGNIVPPAKFIGIAERNGMILALGKRVFEKVCEFLQRVDIQALGLQYIEVNLSVVQCGYKHLANDYIEIIEQYHTDPKQINLEITESASVGAKQVLLKNMDTLRKYGISFSLDDFGTGQANLNYIVDMPVDIVKFDRDMTTAYFENARATHVMNAAIHMIHGMQLHIVAEGIETKEQFEAMDKIGISYIQGYYFSKPRPEKDFISFIREKNLPAEAEV